MTENIIDTDAVMMASENSSLVANVARSASASAAAAALKRASAGTLPSSSSSNHVVAQPLGVRRSAERMLGVSSSDVHEQMRLIEDRHRIYNDQARYLKYRRVLVDWMCEAGDEFQLQSSTMHVAVMYLDRLLQQVDVKRNCLQAAAICCILVASKYEEPEEFVPAISELTEYASNTYTPEYIQKLERDVLDRLGWHLTEVTPLHFLGYYLLKGVLFTTDRMQGKKLVEKVPRYMKKYGDFFADLCLQEYSFQQYPSSLLAAAVVMASRRALAIVPYWCPELSALAEYKEETVTPVYEHIWRYYQMSFPSSPSGQQQSVGGNANAAVASAAAAKTPGAGGAASGGGVDEDEDVEMESPQGVADFEDC